MADAPKTGLNDQVEELLVQWQLAFEDGVELSVEQLCSDAPELHDQVTRGIKALKATSWMLDDEEEHATSRPKLSLQETALPESKLQVSEFISSIGNSGVIADNSLLDNYSKENWSSAKQLAEKLVEDKVLTQYQARVLLEQSDIPLLLDRYLILDVLGEGGMGIVFKALHRSMDRIVALKMLPPFAVSSDEKVARFKREIKAVASIAHPNVVAAYDAHQFDGTWFLVMEYVKGMNLAETVLKNGPIPPDEAVNIVSQIASGLAEAHRHGIVHRDIKPSNIMLSDKGIPKLLDLGLASTKQLAQELEHTKLTNDGIAMGTIDYMSPEQAADSTKADERSDIYSLGCTLYFLLSGKALFESATAIETVVAHREREAPTLSSLDSEIPQRVQSVFRKMIAKKPQDRQASAEQVVRELSGASPVTASATVSSSAASKTDSKHGTSGGRLIKALPKALLLGSILAIAGWIGWQSFGDSGEEISDSERRDVAKWILTSEGTIDVDTALGPQQLIDASEIPDGEFSIYGIDLSADLSNTNSLEPLKKLKDLRSLGLTGFSSIDHASLSGLKRLERLQLGSCRIDQQTASAIGNMVQLQYLDLSSSELADGNLEFLKKLKRLEELDLTAAGFNPQQLEVLQRLPRMTTLSLSSSEVVNSDFVYLPDHLESLTLIDCDIDDQGLTPIAQMQNLVDLDLDGTKVTNEGIKQLSKLGQLYKLDLSNTEVTASGLKALKSFPSLESLVLNGITIDDEKVEAIKSLERITHLDLYKTELSDEQFLSLSSLMQLESVSIEIDSISESALEKFHSNAPWCKVELIVGDLDYLEDE